MQLGARWNVGTRPHRSVPESLYELIHEQELRFPNATSWTLTWLEGRARCALNTGVIVTSSVNGVPSVIEAVEHSPEALEDDDDWLK